ncbi:M23 family metallopeptidase [Candidatus Jorgensenbacteria bacterium]|nr:M23 family metallopeptidase [Candidatus Jorgensenbacteria bacterium]
MKRVLFFILVFLACGTVVLAEDFTLTKTAVEQADVFGVMRRGGAGKSFQAIFRGDTVNSFSLGNNEIAFIGIHYKAKIGRGRVSIVENGKLVLDAVVTIVSKFPKREGPATSFNLTIARNIEKAHQAIKEACERSATAPLFTEVFHWPVASVKIHNEPHGYFGASRGNRYHRGVDLESDLYDTVRAVNGGRVQLVGNFTKTLEGNTLIIDHGYGILSMYLHLSNFLVKEGDVIVPGQAIATVGKTGLQVVRPHLHFMIKMQRFSTVDPVKFMEFWEEYK